MESLNAKYIDRNPTQVKLESGEVASPDKEGRFSLAYMEDGRREYRCDDKPVSMADFFGATTGRDSIPPKIRTFGGIGDGKLRRAYETDEEYNQRVGTEQEI